MYQYQRISPYWAALMPPMDAFAPAPVGIPQQQIFNDNDTINVGSGTQIISGNPSPVTVTLVTTPTYNALGTDYFLCVDTTTTPVTITLPTGILGTVYMVKDCSGDANINNITIQGTGGQLVDGSGSATINSPYGNLQFIFNGTEWSIA